MALEAEFRSSSRTGSKTVVKLWLGLQATWERWYITAFQALQVSHVQGEPAAVYPVVLSSCYYVAMCELSIPSLMP